MAVTVSVTGVADPPDTAAVHSPWQPCRPKAFRIMRLLSFEGSSSERRAEGRRWRLHVLRQERVTTTGRGQIFSRSAGGTRSAGLPGIPPSVSKKKRHTVSRLTRNALSSASEVT
jgi:hypothetical protein